MYSEVQHIFYSSMSNPELFHIKDDKEELSNFEVLKRPTLKFQTECRDNLSSSSKCYSQDKKEDNNDQEKEDEKHLQSRIVLSKQSDSEASTPSSRKQHKVEGEEDNGFRTPTCLDHKIPVAKQCPPAPRKPKPSLKRKASQSSCSCRYPLDLSKEVELLFPTQHNPFSDSHQSTKKVRREEPK